MESLTDRVMADAVMAVVEDWQIPLRECNCTKSLSSVDIFLNRTYMSLVGMVTPYIGEQHIKHKPESESEEIL